MGLGEAAEIAGSGEADTEKERRGTWKRLTPLNTCLRELKQLCILSLSLSLSLIPNTKQGVPVLSTKHIYRTILS